MLFIFMGESCTGKSKASEEMKKMIDFQEYTGKDYLRFAKSEPEAWSIFMSKLKEAAETKINEGSSVVYIISDRDYVQKIGSIDKAVLVKFTAELDDIKKRFSERIHGNLSKPVEFMLERKRNQWKDIEGDIIVNSSNSDAVSIARIILKEAGVD